MRLHKGRHAQRFRERYEFRKGFLRKGRRYKKHCVRSGRPRLVNLIRVYYEILSQKRQRDLAPYHREVFKASVKIFLVRQNRYRGRAVFLVRPRYEKRVEVASYYPLRRRTFLYLTNDVYHVLHYGGCEDPRRTRDFNPLNKGLVRHEGAPCRHLRLLMSEYLFEYAGL